MTSHRAIDKINTIPTKAVQDVARTAEWLRDGKNWYDATTQPGKTRHAPPADVVMVAPAPQQMQGPLDCLMSFNRLIALEGLPVYIVIANKLHRIAELRPASEEWIEVVLVDQRPHEYHAIRWPLGLYLGGTST